MKNEEITQDQKVIQQERTFYKDLYTSSEAFEESSFNSFVSKIEIPKISNLNKDICEGAITMEEIKKVLPTFQRNKSPGNDGLPMEFYVVFSNQVLNILVESLNQSFTMGELSTSQKQGVITLIEKKNQDKRFLKNWRPITLLNVDTKIASKAIAKRIESTLPDIIHYTQSAYVPGRFIGENVRLIDDLLSFTRENKIPGLMMAIDFEKAFDSVEWPCIWNTLKAFNFGPSIIQWAKTFYSNVSSCVMNSGFSTGYFSIQRGVRQGDPLSPFLFIIVIELLLLSIRQTDLIRGILINDSEIKTSAFADDITIFLDGLRSTQNLFILLERFQKCSGLKINKHKCEAFWLGPNKDKEDFPLDIRWTKGITILGIYFSYNETEVIEKNFYKNIDRMQSVCNIWKQRNLSLLGKITIIKSLLISKIQYVCGVLYTPQAVINKINSILYNFLWNGKDKIKRKAIIQDYEEGGMKMMDFESYVKARHIMWTKRLLDDNYHDWKRFPLYYFRNFGGPKLFFASEFSRKTINIYIPKFYESLIKSFKTVAFEEEFMNQTIWNNKNILSQNYTVFFKQFYDSGIIFVHHLFGSNGKILSWNSIQEKYSLPKALWIQYAGLCQMVPKQWKERALRNLSVCPKLRKSLSYNIVDKADNVCDLSKVKSKQVYNCLVSFIVEEPTGRKKLATKYNLTSDECKDIFKLPLLVTISNTLRSFQFKLLHNILFFNEFLARKTTWCMSPLCSFCQKESETTEHALFSCPLIRIFWDQVFSWLDVPRQKECETLTGVKLPDKENGLACNFALLVARHFIYECKLKGEIPSLQRFLISLNAYYEIESFIARKNNRMEKHIEKWKGLSAKLEQKGNPVLSN